MPVCWCPSIDNGSKTERLFDKVIGNTAVMYKNYYCDNDNNVFTIFRFIENYFIDNDCDGK